MVKNKITHNSNEWKDAIIDELVCCHIYSNEHERNPRKAINDIICWNVGVALDPKVSSDARELIDKAIAAEREACAKVCKMRQHSGYDGHADFYRALK